MEKAQEWMINRPYNISDARVAAHALLASRNRPSALICGNDQIAIGAMIQATSEGLSVPGDLSITGFNDLELVEHLNPPLTTMRVPFEDIGRISAELLLRSIEDRSFVPTPFEVPATLIVRGSTAALRQKEVLAENHARAD
jgi:LacI family transcriptional regulator